MGTVLETTLYLSSAYMVAGVFFAALVAGVLFPKETKQLLEEFKKRMGGK